MPFIFQLSNPPLKAFSSFSSSWISCWIENRRAGKFSTVGRFSRRVASRLPVLCRCVAITSPNRNGGCSHPTPIRRECVDRPPISISQPQRTCPLNHGGSLTGNANAAIAALGSRRKKACVHEIFEPARPGLVRVAADARLLNLGSRSLTGNSVRRAGSNSPPGSGPRPELRRTPAPDSVHSFFESLSVPHLRVGDLIANRRMFGACQHLGAWAFRKSAWPSY
jgi:hypothetical protein